MHSPRHRPTLLSGLLRCVRACLRALALRQAHSHAWLKKG
jgi:hypothetical protein